MNDNKANDAATEAQLWVVRLRDDELNRDGRLNAEFQRWLNSSLEHREAYKIASTTFAVASASKGSDKYGPNTASERLGSRTGLWLRFGAVAAAVTVLIFLTTGSWDHASNIERMAAVTAFEPLATQRGEIRMFTLSDGSVATLDTDTRIEVAMNRDTRLLRLGKGRARLDIADDERPFTVEAGAGAVVAQRAIIDVAYADNQFVTLNLIRGDAKLRPKSQYASFAHASRTLAAGDLLTFGVQDFQVADWKTDGLDPDWPSGWVEAEGIRLDALIAKANVYASTPVILDDAIIGALKVSGRFKINDTEGFVRRICELFDLTANRRRDGTYIRKR